MSLMSLATTTSPMMGFGVGLEANVVVCLKFLQTYLCRVEFGSRESVLFAFFSISQACVCKGLSFGEPNWIF